MRAIPSLEAEAATFGIRHNDIVRCVETQTRVENLIPKLIFGICCGSMLVYLLMSIAAPAIFLIGITFALLVAKIVSSIAQASLLEPLRTFRYKAAAKQLARGLDSTNDLALPACCWFAGAPGALAVRRDGRLLLVCRESGYQELRLSPWQIADVRVDRNLTQFTRTTHSGQCIYGSSHSMLGAYVTGGRSTSVTRTFEAATLRIAYQLESNTAVISVDIPCADSGFADNLCALIARMETRHLTPQF